MRSGKCDHVIKEGSEDVARGEVRGDGRCGWEGEERSEGKVGEKSR
jgi:hypothetical protein